MSDTGLAKRADAPTTSVATPTAPTIKRSLVYVYVGYLFRYVYLLVLIPFYGRVLGAEEYGRVLAAMSLYQVIWVIVEWGFPVAGARDIGQSTSEQGAAREFGRHLGARLLMSLIAIFAGVGATLYSPIFSAHHEMGLLATTLGILAAFNLGWYFQATLRFRTSVALEVLGFALNLGFILTLVRGPGDAIYVLWSLLASSSIVTVVCYATALRSMSVRELRLHGSLALIRESLALFGTRGLAIGLSSASTYLFSLFATPLQVGHLGAAERVATLGISLMTPAQQVMVGSINHRLGGQGDLSKVYPLLRKGAFFLLAYGFGALLVCFVAAPWAVPLIFGPGYGPTVPLLQAYALIFPLAALTQFCVSYVMTPMRRDRQVTAVLLLGAALYVSALCLSAGTIGAFGVVASRIASELLVLTLLVLLLQRLGVLQGLFARQKTTEGEHS